MKSRQSATITNLDFANTRKNVSINILIKHAIKLVAKTVCVDLKKAPKGMQKIPKILKL